MRTNTRSVSGTGLIAASRLEFGQNLSKRRIDLWRRVALVSRTPKCNGGMISEPQDLVSDIRNVGFDVGWVRSITRVSLKEFVPNKNAVFIAQRIEIFACALTNPVANHIHIRRLVHADLGLEPLSRNALHPFVETPVSSADKHLDAVHRNRKIFSSRHAVSNLADTEAD